MIRFLFFLLFYSSLFGQSLSVLRVHLKKAVESDVVSDSENFHILSKKAFEVSNEPINQAFYATSFFLKAKHSYNPISKISYFKKGKQLLNEAVTKNRKEIEIRFLRLCIQENLPSFLNYKVNLEEDTSFILKNYEKIADPQLKQLVKLHFKI